MSTTFKNVQQEGQYARRRSLLELAPLELDCMTALWLLGEGTVREIRETLAPRTIEIRAYRETRVTVEDAFVSMVRDDQKAEDGERAA